MSQIQDMYYDWAEDHADSSELSKAYKKLSDTLTGMVGEQKYDEIDDLVMQCVELEKSSAFKGGFQKATMIWKECC